MKIYDITLPVTPHLPVWPGDPPILLEQVESMDRGAHANVSRLALSVHTGTHVDAPHHFLNDGRTVENLSLEVLTGRALVVRIPDEEEAITPAVLERANISNDVQRILFRTRNSELWHRADIDFEPGFVAIPAEGAMWLVARGINLVGIDYLSVAPYKQSAPTHRSLLRAGIVVLEGLDLSAVLPGFYDLFCLPLKLVGSDGAPARAILIG